MHHRARLQAQNPRLSRPKRDIATLLQRLEHFCCRRQEKVAKSVQCGEPFTCKYVVAEVIAVPAIWRLGAPS